MTPSASCRPSPPRKSRGGARTSPGGVWLCMKKSGGAQQWEGEGCPRSREGAKGLSVVAEHRVLSILGTSRLDPRAWMERVGLPAQLNRRNTTIDGGWWRLQQYRQIYVCRNVVLRTSYTAAQDIKHLASSDVVGAEQRKGTHGRDLFLENTTSQKPAQKLSEEAEVLIFSRERKRKAPC